MKLAYPPTLTGLTIIYSDMVLKATEKRLFSVSRHRSRRTHKKLIKRFGGEFKQVPCIWQFGNQIYAHPSFRDRFERELGN